MLIDPLRVYVLWAPRRAGANDPGRRLARALRSQLDLVGMIRDGIGFRIPVRQRSLAWRPASPPRPVDLAGARWNVVIVVQDDVMRLRPEWAPYVARIARDMDERGGADLLLPVLTSPGDNLPVIDERKLQGIVAPTPNEDTDEAWEGWLRRVTMYAMGVIWAHQRTARLRQNHSADTGDDVRKIGVFLSHAKKDGEGAALLVERFRRLAPTKDRVGVNSIEMFFDTYDLVAGGPYSEQFKIPIRDGALLAVVTDAYHGRPWCMWEVLCAKENKSPILLWDLSHRGTLRSFPYLGNVPVLRTPGARYKAGNAADPAQLILKSIGDQEIERVLMALLSEAMRMELWSAHAEALVKAGGMTQQTTMVCARPPELADLVYERARGATTIVYPDPPIGLHEKHLLAAAFPQMTLLPLSEVL
jgi:hypothetical protein